MFFCFVGFFSQDEAARQTSQEWLDWAGLAACLANAETKKTKNKKQKKKKQQQRGFSVLLLVCVFFSTNAFSLSLSLSFLSDARALTSARVGKETRKRGWSGSE